MLLVVKEAIENLFGRFNFRFIEINNFYSK